MRGQTPSSWEFKKYWIENCTNSFRGDRHQGNLRKCEGNDPSARLAHTGPDSEIDACSDDRLHKDISEAVVSDPETDAPNFEVELSIRPWRPTF